MNRDDYHEKLSREALKEPKIPQTTWTCTHCSKPNGTDRICCKYCNKARPT